MSWRPCSEGFLRAIYAICDQSGGRRVLTIQEEEFYAIRIRSHVLGSFSSLDAG